MPNSLLPGSIKSRKLRERLEPPEKPQNYPELISELKATEDNERMIEILYNIYSTVRGGNKNKATDLKFLINHLKILKQDAFVYLNKFKHDKIIMEVKEYKNDVASLLVL